MIAKTIILAEPAVSSAGLTASDISAIFTVVVAVLALGFSIVSAEVQRRHNVLVARPHMDVDMNLTTALLRLENHGPGVARLVSFKGTVADKTFDLLSAKGLEDFTGWLKEGMDERLLTSPYLLPAGTYIAPHLTKDLVTIKSNMSDADSDKLARRLSAVSYDLSYKSIYEKTYTDHHDPIELGNLVPGTPSSDPAA